MDRDLPPLDIYIDIPRRLQFLHRDVGGAYEEPEAPDNDSASTVAADESEESSSEDYKGSDFEPSSEDDDDTDDLSYLDDD